MTVEGTVPVLFSDDDEADVENDPLNSIYWKNVIDNTSVDSKDENLKAGLISCGQSTSYMNIIKEDPVVSAMIREKAKSRENVLRSPLARRCNPDHDEYDMHGLIANDSEQKQRRYEMTSTRSPLKQPNVHYSFFVPSEVEPRPRHPHMPATPLTEKEITLARREKLIRSILNRGDDPEFCPSTTPRRQRVSWLPSPPKRMLRPRKKEWSDDDDIPLTELSKQIHGDSYDLEAELALRRVLSETTPSRRGRTATRSASTAPSTSTRKRIHSSQRVTTPSRPRNTRRSCVLILEQEEEDCDEEKEQAQRRSAKRRRLAHSPSPCEWIPPNEALASARRRRIRKEMEESESEDDKTLSELRAESQRSAERAKRRRQPVNYTNMDWTPEK